MPGVLHPPCQVEKMAEIRQIWLPAALTSDLPTPIYGDFHQLLVFEFGRFRILGGLILPGMGRGTVRRSRMVEGAQRWH